MRLLLFIYIELNGYTLRWEQLDEDLTVNGIIARTPFIKTREKQHSDVFILIKNTSL